jgi:hypothetical protein
MKKHKVLFFLSLFTLIALYLIGCFVSLNFNVIQWDYSLRIILGFCCFAFIFIPTIVTIIFDYYD